MKSQKLFFRASLILSLLFVSCSNDDDGIYFGDSNEILVTYSDLEYEILDLVNDHRTGLGLDQLNVLNAISSEAEPHVDYMLEKGVPSHDNFGVRHSNLTSQINAKKVAENVAYGYTSAESVVRAWLKSPHHREIIETPEFTDFGIAIKANEVGRNYFTHIFVTR